MIEQTAIKDQSQIETKEVKGEIEKTSQNNSNLPAGVAGAGGGALLLSLANNLPASNMYKSWLIITAPFISLGLAVFWKWGLKRMDKYLKDRKFENFISQVRTEGEKALQRPDILPEEKSAIQKKLSLLEKQILEQKIAKALASIEF